MCHTYILSFRLKLFQGMWKSSEILLEKKPHFFFLFAPNFGHAAQIFHFRTLLKLDISVPINGDSITMTWNVKLIIHAYNLIHLQRLKGALDNPCCFVLTALTGAWTAIMETLWREKPATHACAQGHLQAIGILHIPVTRTPSLHN